MLESLREFDSSFKVFHSIKLPTVVFNTVFLGTILVMVANRTGKIRIEL